MERAHEKVGLLLFSRCVEGMSHGRRNIFPWWRRGSQFKMRREENEGFFFFLNWFQYSRRWVGRKHCGRSDLLAWLFHFFFFELLITTSFF